MVPRPPRRPLPPRLTAALAATLVLGAGRVARADPPSPDELARLGRGATLAFEQTVESDRRRYIGGVAYTVVDAAPEDVASVLEDPRAWREILPRTKSARRVAPPGPRGRGAARDFWIELRQGNQVVDAVYTLRVRPDEDGTYRFWLDPTLPHDIADAWGYFRPTLLPSAGGRAPRTLLAYGVLVDVGDGLVRVFEERVRPVLLAVPDLLKSYVAARAAARYVAKKT